MFSMLRCRLAVIGEPETSRVVEHQIIRPLKRLAIAFAVESCEPSRVQVEALDRAAAIVVRFMTGNVGARCLVPLKAAVVADVERVIRSDCESVRSTARLGD